MDQNEMCPMNLRLDALIPNLIKVHQVVGKIKHANRRSDIVSPF